MSVWLYRWGKHAYDRPWRVIGAWLAVLGVIVGLLIANPVHLSNEVRIDGTPSQQAIDELVRDLPEASGGQGLLAFRAPEGRRMDAPPQRQALLAALDAVYTHEHVIDTREVMAAEAGKGEGSVLLRAAAIAAASPPAREGGPVPLTVDGRALPGVLLSADGTVALLQFQFDEQTYALPAGTIDDTIEAATRATAGSGVEVLPGAAMMEIPEIVGIGEIVGLAVAAIVLLITLGSVVAAGLPLAVALSGVAVGVGGAFALSTVIEMHSLTAVLALMLGLAVGIDYALFIVSRTRRLIAEHGLDAREAAARAVGTAGSAVLFAGSTVIIALLGLAVVRITLLTTMAAVAAATITVVVLLALTLLPALLGLVGERISASRRRLRAGKASGRIRFARSWSRMLVRHRAVAVAAAVLIPAVLAVPALDMRLGLPSGAAHDSGTPQRQSYEAVSSAFGPGQNGPLMVIARSVRDGVPLDPRELAGIHTRLRATEGVSDVSLAGMSSAGDIAVLSLVPVGGPDDDRTRELVEALREETPTLAGQSGAELSITGFTALGIDVSDRLADALPLYLVTVLVLSLLILTLVFRSLFIPVQATVGFTLSIAATFGATTAVFQWGGLQSLLGIDATTPVMSLLPIIVTGVLYGLAMDYQVFLVTSMREEHIRGAAAQEAVVLGFEHAGRVVTAAAVIMVSVFGGFVFNPEPMIKQVGFALAFGILIDAFLVRMVLIPAALAVAGERAWWLPRRLERTLPRLDVEGARLHDELSPSLVLPETMRIA